MTEVTAGPAVSFEEFLKTSTEEHNEWVGGRVVPMSAVDKPHADLLDFLVRTLGAYVDTKELGRLYQEPFVMKLGPELPARSPDLMFVQNERLSKLRESHLDGPCTLAVEIISPGSRSRDRGEKFYEYEQAGVAEYWLLDPRRRQAEFYLLGQDGIYRPVPADQGSYRSRELEGLEFPVEWLWGPPFPKLLDALREWNLV